MGVGGGGGGGETFLVGGVIGEAALGPGERGGRTWERRVLGSGEELALLRRGDLSLVGLVVGEKIWDVRLDLKGGVFLLEENLNLGRGLEGLSLLFESETLRFGGFLTISWISSGDFIT